MLNLGDTFGDYTVIRLLGQGVMGSVFLLENMDEYVWTDEVEVRKADRWNRCR